LDPANQLVGRSDGARKPGFAIASQVPLVGTKSVLDDPNVKRRVSALPL
jgi:hypothetical protein